MPYNPRLILRQVTNSLLAAFFSRYSGFSGFNWNRLSETNVEPIFATWQQLPEPERFEVSRIFREAHSLATASRITTLIEAARDSGIDITQEMRARRSGAERALWCYMHHLSVFESALTLTHIDGLPARSWEKRTGLARREDAVPTDTVAELGRAISEYYLQRDGRGEKCVVEYRRRASNIDSFFAYPADFADEMVGYGENGEFARYPWNGAFEVVFTYDGAAGTLDLFAEGGKQVRGDLAELFARVVLGESHQLPLWEHAPYNLEVFKNPHLALPTDPADRISVRVRGIRFAIGRSRGRIALDAGCAEAGSVYSLLQEAVDLQRVPLSEVTMLEATLQASLPAFGARRRSMTFKISPSGCTLGDSREEERLKGYLRRWNITAA
jgi:hypothetical protein